MNARKVFEKAITLFICPTCASEHDTKGEAKKCCPLEIETVFNCATCGEFHDEKKDANNCCIEWECTDCGEVFDDKKDANNCCKDEG